MRIVEFDDVGQEAWNWVAEQSDDAWLFHRYHWVHIESSFAANANYSFAIADDRQNIVGILPLYLRLRDRGWLERVLDSGYHRHTGLAVLNDLSESQRKTAVKLAMNHLFDVADHVDADRILLNRQILAPSSFAGKNQEIPFWVSDYGFELGMHVGPFGDVAVPGSSTAFADQVVDLSQTEQTLFRGMDVAAIRKAERSGLVFSADVPNPVETYYELARISAERTGEQLLPKDYYSSILREFQRSNNAMVLFAMHNATPVAAVILVLDKKAVSYLAGVSHHDYLSMNVNDFLLYKAICWSKEKGCRWFRLGPVFPEVPESWPVAKVSWFKGKFGGKSMTTVQGNYFRKPERYLDDCIRIARESCEARIQITRGRRELRESKTGNALQDLARTLRRYGFMAISPNPTENELFNKLSIWSSACKTPFSQSDHDIRIIFQTKDESLDRLGVDCRLNQRKNFIYRKRSWSGLFHRKPVYRAVCNYVSFSGPNLEPIWQDEQGNPVIAWHHQGKKRTLLIGLDFAEEVIRCTQGDPGKVDSVSDKTRFNFTFERANYLFDDLVDKNMPNEPWADNLGFTVAELVSQLTAFPLVEPLPDGAKGAVMLTGDDDQAALEKYAEQMQVVGDFPISYFLLPMTKHTPATLSELPPNVELALHVDALEQPERYDQICKEQCRDVRELTGKPINAIRNHGFLNRGYLGHLRAWEHNDLVLDVNYAGLDGTILNGSLLPGLVRRPDRTWSKHCSLLTAFGDGMIYITNWNEQKAIARINKLTKQIEHSHPGVLVFNMHPENISDTTLIHRAIMELGRKKDWMALGSESYARWLQEWNKILIAKDDQEIVLRTGADASRLVLRTFQNNQWQRTSGTSVRVERTNSDRRRRTKDAA